MGNSLDWLEFTQPPRHAMAQAARDGVTLFQISPRFISRQGEREPGQSTEWAKSPLGPAPTTFRPLPFVSSEVETLRAHPTCNRSIGSSSGSDPLSWPETACLVLIMFGLLYIAEIIAEAATRT